MVLDRYLNLNLVNMALVIHNQYKIVNMKPRGPHVVMRVFYLVHVKNQIKNHSLTKNDHISVVHNSTGRALYMQVPSPFPVLPFHPAVLY